MSEKKPRLEFQSNVPKTVRLMRFGASGENEYGTWNLWNFEEDGVEKCWFVPDKVHEKLQEIKPGTTLTIIKEEKKTSKGSAFHEYSVNETVFDDAGVPPPPPVDILEDKQARESMKQKLENLWWISYLVARDVLTAVNSDETTPQIFHQSREDLQKVATTTFLSLVKKI